MTVTIATLNGTALAGNDYTALVSGPLTFTPGQTVKTVNVTVLGDRTDEGVQETFSVLLSNPSGATLGDGVDFDATAGFGVTDTATPGQDFVPITGTLTFAPGATVLTSTVQIAGDFVPEGDERFQTVLSNGTVPLVANANIGVIVNDDSTAGSRLALPFVAR